jgi:hypothetical protein
MVLSLARLAVHGLCAVLLGIGAAEPAAGQEKTPPTYRCQGFDEPMHRPNIQIPKGRVLPLRAKLVLPDGTFGDASTLKAPPAISLKYQPESGPEVDKTEGLEVRDYGKGNRFVFDAEAHWKFDLGTSNLTEDGKYAVTLSTGDPKEYTVDPPCTLVFFLRSK